MKKRVTCTRCSHYSRGAGRCLKGKANPPTKKNTLAVADLMGPLYVCSQNPWIEAHWNELLAKMERSSHV